MKLLVCWLLGLKSDFEKSSQPVLKLLSTVLAHDGDLQAEDNIRLVFVASTCTLYDHTNGISLCAIFTMVDGSTESCVLYHCTFYAPLSLSHTHTHTHSAPDRSRLRLTAGCGLLKLARSTHYRDLITHEQFQRVALVMQVSCTCGSSICVFLLTWF